jgi:hypothetical protein
MFESKSGILFIAGIGFFALAFLGNAVVPMLMYAHVPEKTAEEMVNRNTLIQFRDLQLRYPEEFARHIGELTPENEVQKCADALRRGRKIYTGEACWHCHSQFIRPVANEEKRWGPVSRSGEYQNELQRPVLFGTRRVGPDLIRVGGTRSNDWHAAHFFNPKLTSPESVMPEYPWFFDGSPLKPNGRGLALITYVQWLGSWQPHYFTNYKAPDGSAAYGP